MSDPTFPNLLRGNRDSGFLGLKMLDGYAKKLGPDYTYVEVPLLLARTGNGEEVEGKALRNQQVELVAPCTLAPIPQYKGLVSINPMILQYASAPSLLLIDHIRNPKEHALTSIQQEVMIPCRFWKDLDLTKVDWLARIYLIS